MMEPKSSHENCTIRRSMYIPSVEECTQRFSLGPQQHLLNDEMMLDSLEELLKQTWTIWGVSSLFGFQSDELQLKLYAKKLREEVAATLPHEDVTYSAQFTILDTIALRPRAEDPPPIKVEVFSKTMNEADIKKNIYTGIFISWRTILTESSCDGTMKLPLLLCRGTKSAMKAVHTIIGHMFDCQIVSLSATEDELEWLVPMMLNPTEGDEKLKSKGEIRLEYRIPGLPGSDSIIVNFQDSALLKLWITISESNDDESETEYYITAESVSKFHEVIKTQMKSVAGLQLGFCVLNKISLPFFTMMDNRIKASTTGAMHRFLLFFNDRSLKSLHTLDYDTTQTVTSETTPQ